MSWSPSRSYPIFETKPSRTQQVAVATMLETGHTCAVSREAVNKRSLKAILLFDANRASVSDLLFEREIFPGGAGKYAEYSVELIGRKLKLP